MTPTTLELTRPDDWHLHLRDGAMLEAVVDATARAFGRAIVMPNLAPPVVTGADAMAYRERILAATSVPGFRPLMTLYLTETTDPDDVAAAHASGAATACKLYPAGATTNSASGVRDVRAIDAVLERMEAVDMPLLIHGEVVDADIDVFDREKVFIDRVLAPLVERFPKLRVVLEHITTEDAVQFVTGARDGIAATITAHHLRIDRNALFDGGLRPHAYCLPLAKRALHKTACARPRQRGPIASSWARTRRRTPAGTRSRIAAARASTAPRWRSRATRRPSRRRMRSNTSSCSPRSPDRASTAWSRMRRRSCWNEPSGPFRRSWPPARSASCPSTPARCCAGACATLPESQVIWPAPAAMSAERWVVSLKRRTIMRPSTTTR